MRFPVILKTRERYRAPARLWYEVAANGLFQVRETETYRAVTRAESGVPGLVTAREELVLRAPRLPAALLSEVLALFREAWRRYQGEALVMLFYCERDRTFEAAVPPQTLSVRRGGHLAVRYGTTPTPRDSVRFGTIHSHADLPAFASAVDCEDEGWEDGLHVVFGHIDTRWPSRSACFVANGVRFRLDPERVLEPCDMPTAPARAAWIDQLACES